jgi:hypothetical protein
LILNKGIFSLLLDAPCFPVFMESIEFVISKSGGKQNKEMPDDIGKKKGILFSLFCKLKKAKKGRI